jgi:hypothetical protein
MGGGLFFLGVEGMEEESDQEGVGGLPPEVAVLVSAVRVDQVVGEEHRAGLVLRSVGSQRAGCSERSATSRRPGPNADSGS